MGKKEVGKKASEVSWCHSGHQIMNMSLERHGKSPGPVPSAGGHTFLLGFISVYFHFMRNGRK